MVGTVEALFDFTEQGPINQNDWLSLMKLKKIQKELDYYQKFTPVNFTEERIKFFEHVKKNQPYNPLFEYNDRLDAKDYEEIKIALKKEKGRDAIIDEFLNVYIDVADMIIAWKKDDYQGISCLSGKLFGSIDDFDLQRAIQVFKSLRVVLQNAEDKYNDRQIGARFSKELVKRNLEGWVIEYNAANGGNVSIYETEKRLVIRTGATETKLGLECAISHELDGHAAQAFNAMANTRYSEWFLSYLGTERQYEGYATFVEINNLSIAHINCELESFLVLMIATALAQQASFWEIYQEIYNLCEDRDFSYLAAFKAKRGFRDTAQAGCFQKENSYLLGAIENVKLVEKNRENYYRLSQGCFPLSAIELISKKRPKWEIIKDLNKENLEYFKHKMKKIMK